MPICTISASGSCQCRTMAYREYSSLNEVSGLPCSVLFTNVCMNPPTARNIYEDVMSPTLTSSQLYSRFAMNRVLSAVEARALSLLPFICYTTRGKSRPRKFAAKRGSKINKHEQKRAKHHKSNVGTHAHEHIVI